MRYTLRLLCTLTALILAGSALADGNAVGGGGLGKPTPGAVTVSTTHP